MDKDKVKLLEILKRKMEKDDSLPLKKGATQLVFGVGDPDSPIVFIGEGPGYWEDKKGIPFVGNAGAFLNQLLLYANLKREKVFITNVIHYRPPQNRDPEAYEIEAFQPYLDKIIDIIKPKVVVSLGRFSMAKFLPNTRITSVHGKKFSVGWKNINLVVVPMYHPAAGLRNPDIKFQTIEDFKKLPIILEEVNKEEEVKKKEVKQMSLV